MSKNRDDEPGCIFCEPIYIFCNAEMKEAIAKRSGDDMPPDEMFVVADVVQPGMCIVVFKSELRQWLYSRENNFDMWTL